MLEHISLCCRDVSKSAAFYERALAPLGYKRTQNYDDAVGFMADGHTSFWVTKGTVGTPTHVAFRAKSRKAVVAFHEAALTAGGRDNGAPGVRAYSATYYAAFVHDRDGHNIEAVTFAKPRSRSRTRSRRPRAK
jgi:catechol 2,3-dioxygenase-like lactoylglutathione lyase family enzyme